MLTSVLARAVGVVGEIIKNPVGFLDNLIAGVKGGILKFKDNIVEHLRKGLMSWLFGALAEGGVELPDTFDVKGVIKLLASVFGLTWANIRNRLVKQIGEKAMAAAEKGVSIFQTIASEGIAGLWHMLIDKLGDIKEMILAQVHDFVITKIITAGITWLISLLNPAAAFIKACKLIYDVVMFFVDNAARIAKFVNTIIDSVADIVRGNISGVVDKIDDVLGQMVPIIIGFLADVIDLGGIGAEDPPDHRDPPEAHQQGPRLRDQNRPKTCAAPSSAASRGSAARSRPKSPPERPGSKAKPLGRCGPCGTGIRCERRSRQPTECMPSTGRVGGRERG